MRGARVVRLVSLILVCVLFGAQSAMAAPALGGIQGTLMRGNSGTPMNGGHVQLYNAGSGSSYGGTDTAGDGTWAMSVPEGDYWVFLQGINAFYASAYWRGASLTPVYTLAQAVTVTADDTQTCDATLPAAGQITGTVTSAVTHAATNATVKAYWWDGVTSQWVSAYNTSINGAYTMQGVLPGTYKLSAEWSGWVTDYYNGKTSLASADTTIVVGEGSGTYSPALMPVGVSNGIHGTVRRGDGSPAANTPQYFYRINAGGSLTAAGWQMTANDGTFDAVLTPGNYKVVVRGGNPYGSGWWAESGPEALASRAQTVTVSLGTTETIEATLPLAATVAGAVKTHATGAAIPTATVTPYLVNPSTGLWEPMFGTMAYGGTYSFGELLPGTYRLEFAAENTRYLSQFWNGKTSLVSADGIAVTAGQSLTGYDVVLSADVASESIAGPGRIDTAIEASKKMYPDATTHAGAVIITTGYNWPDALGASALAGVLNAPVLLNTGVSPDWRIVSDMPDSLTNEARRLKDNGATDVYILGDTNAVSNLTERHLGSIFRDLFTGPKVHRIGGYGRYATSLAIANEVRTRLGGSWDGVVFLAKGTDYPDALAAAPLAARQGWPVVLAEGDGRGGLSARVKDFLAANATSKVIILGSTNAIPASVADAAAAAVGGAGKVERWEGADRVATAIDVAEHSVANGMSFSGVGVATAYNYPDGLCAGPYLAKKNNPLLLTADALPLRPALSTKLGALSPEVEMVRFFGGTPAIRQTVRDTIVDKLR